jgi:hypothetical protein
MELASWHTLAPRIWRWHVGFGKVCAPCCIVHSVHDKNHTNLRETGIKSVIRQFNTIHMHVTLYCGVQLWIQTNRTRSVVFTCLRSVALCDGAKCWKRFAAADDESEWRHKRHNVTVMSHFLHYGQRSLSKALHQTSRNSHPQNSPIIERACCVRG